MMAFEVSKLDHSKICTYICFGLYGLCVESTSDEASYFYAANAYEFATNICFETIFFKTGIIQTVIVKKN